MSNAAGGRTRLLVAGPVFPNHIFMNSHHKNHLVIAFILQNLNNRLQKLIIQNKLPYFLDKTEKHKASAGSSF